MAATSFCRSSLRQTHRQPEGREQRPLPGHERRIDPAGLLGQPGGTVHADRHRLAVQERAVAAQGLQGVGERVPVVEHRPRTGLLALVAADHVGLQPAALRR